MYEVKDGRLTLVMGETDIYLKGFRGREQAEEFAEELSVITGLSVLQ